LLRARRFDRIYFLNDLPWDQKERDALSPREFCDWLRSQNFPIEPEHVLNAARPLRNDYADVFDFTIKSVEALRREHPLDQFTLHLSPGYPAAHVAMMLAAQTRFENPVELVNASIEGGVEPVELPFVVSLEDALPRLLRGGLKPDAAKPGV